MDSYDLITTGTRKILRSESYNYDFSLLNGYFIRWGETIDDDPQWSPFGPEIADIEIVTGNCSGGCPWCYKGNGETPGKAMSVETFRDILDKFPDVLTQVALGLTDIDAHPHLGLIMDICRQRGVIPNYTTNGYGPRWLQNTLGLKAGAVAVSVYPHNREEAYDTIHGLWMVGARQVNIHLLYHWGNEGFVKRVLTEATKDVRLDSVNAVVLLGLKPKGRASDMKPASYAQFKEIVDYAMKIEAPIGFDSCSACKFIRWLDESGLEDKVKEQYRMMAEPCESTLFSIYIDVDGNAWPCSFCEGVEEIEPVNVLEVDSIMDAWMGEPFVDFRERLLSTGRKCPVFDLE